MNPCHTRDQSTPMGKALPLSHRKACWSSQKCTSLTQVSIPTNQEAQSLTQPSTEAPLFLCRQGNHHSSCCLHLFTLHLGS